MKSRDDMYAGMRKQLIEQKGYPPNVADAAIEVHRQLVGLCRRMYEEFGMSPIQFVYVASTSLQALATTLSIMATLAREDNDT